MSEVLRPDNFQDFNAIKYGFYTREWGNCGISDKFDMLEQDLNRNAVAYDVGVKLEQFMVCNQVHGTDVVTVTETWKPANRPAADAMVTKLKKVGLGIVSADCGPVLFVDPEAGVIGAAHAGWRGALNNVIERTVEAMEALGADRTTIHAAVGPCIGKNSYEVGYEFNAAFIKESIQNERFFKGGLRSDKFYFDLSSYIEMKARDLQLASFRVTEADTYADEARFFSYRRDFQKRIMKTECQISAIALV